MSDQPPADSSGASATEAQQLETKLTMGIDPYERNWMRLSVVLLVAFFATVSVAGFAMGFQVNGEDGEVDPRTVLDTEPWATPGLREISPGNYQAYVVAQTWNFVPRELEVPVGSTVEIFVTSPDLQHGFKVTDTNINMMVLPGQVSTMTYTFDEVGEFPYICHEYCGRGHAAMFGIVNVVPAVAGSGSDAETEADADTDTDTDTGSDTDGEVGGPATNAEQHGDGDTADGETSS